MGCTADGPRRMSRRPGDVDRLCADSSSFRSLTGWRPGVGLRVGLLRTVNWFRHHPSGVESMAGEEVPRNWEGAG